MTKGKPRKVRRDPRSARRAETGETRWASWTRGGGGRGKASPKALQFTQLNWALLGIAGVLIIVGYLTLASSSPLLSTVVAPVLLVAGYGVFVPVGLII